MSLLICGLRPSRKSQNHRTSNVEGSFEAILASLNLSFTSGITEVPGGKCPQDHQVTRKLGSERKHRKYRQSSQVVLKSRIYENLSNQARQIRANSK